MSIFRYCTVFRRCRTWRLSETISWERTTTRAWKGRRGTSSLWFLTGLGRSSASSGTRGTSRPTSVPTRCCRLWCSAVRRGFRLLSRVSHAYSCDNLRSYIDISESYAAAIMSCYRLYMNSTVCRFKQCTWNVCCPQQCWTGSFGRLIFYLNESSSRIINLEVVHLSSELVSHC